MKHTRILAGILGVAMSASVVTAGDVQYPQTAKGPQTDSYFGTDVADPYRWLEDDNSPETKAWVTEENKVTNAWLEKIPYRSKVKDRLTELFNYAKYSAPFHRKNHYFFYKNDGLQNQSVLYMQDGINGKPEVLLDPNTFSKDGTTRLVAFDVCKDATYAVYGISRGGSDWQEYRIIDLATKKTLDDRLQWVKVSNIGWKGDGFYYSRYDAPTAGKELVSSNEFHKVYFHKVGTAQSADVLVYEDKTHQLRFHTIDTTEDERFSILNISDRGTGKKGNALFVCDNSTGGKDFSPLIPEITDDEFGVIDNMNDQLLVHTNHKAPNGRIVLIDPKHPEEANWKEIVAEQPEPLQSAHTGGGKLFTIYLKDVASQVMVRDLAGKVEQQVQLPTLGSAGGFSGLHDDTEVFYSFTSFTFPPTIYRYDIASGKSTLFRQAQIPHFNPDDYETAQVFYNSKDGTKIPMFLVHKKGLKMDGSNPTLLYGYGGFGITMSPGFATLNLSLLENGFVYAQANLRGGGEYGEKWHEAGTKMNKQNVFDDFIGAAEWLITNKVTSPEKLAIRGGSNGGLLVGATLNQRPELFKAAVAQVGVMDMLRFQTFTIGWNWKPDYGSSEDSAEMFKTIAKYSPLHTIRTDANYPAVLVTTADHDDRVVPAHSFKYAATLQEKAKGGPFLIRIGVNSGHGASSTTKTLEEAADVQSFLFTTLNVQVK